MPRTGRTRLVLATLVVVLAATGCGGGEDSAPVGHEEDSPSTTTEASGDDPREDARTEPATTSVDEAQDEVLSGDSSISEDGPEQPAQPEATVELVEVRLGDRFDWCADLQAVWDAHDEDHAAQQAVGAVLSEAEAVYGAATDELDRAEALEEVEQARSAFREAVEAGDEDRTLAANALFVAYERHLDDSADPLGVASSRAWLAFINAADARTLDAVTGYEDALAAREAGISEADAAVLQAEAAYENAQAVLQRLRDAPVDEEEPPEREPEPGLDPDGVSDLSWAGVEIPQHLKNAEAAILAAADLIESQPLEDMEAAINAAHYASVEALGPPPMEPGHESADEALEAWRASLHRIGDATADDERLAAIGDFFAFLFSYDLYGGPSQAGREVEGVWVPLFQRLENARYTALANASRLVAQRLRDEERAAVKAEFQAAEASVVDAHDAIRQADTARRETVTALYESVDRAKADLFAALVGSLAGNPAYLAYRLSFQESCA